MKKKLLIILLAIISVVACALGLTACNVGDGGDNSGSGSTSLSGTYYLYENGKLDKSQYITFNGSKWSDDDSVNGTFTLNGTTIVFYAEVMGSKEEMFSGTLSDGKLTVKVLGSTMTYYKDGSEPNGSTGGNDTPTGHTHSWDKTWSSDDKYHWYACSGCNEKKDEAQHYYVDGKCVCGKENDNQGNTPTNKEFEVTFNLNYTGATSITRSTEDKLITYIPTRNGYEFNGWYLDSELMHYFDTAEQVTANGLVLYACWVEEATEIGQLSAPVINVVNNVFSWKSIAGATGYRVVVTASASKTDLVDETVRTTNWTFPVSFDAGVYAVKIRAIGDGITTVNSVYSSRNFSLRVLNAVTGIALDRATSLLTWNEVENAEEYNVYVGSKLVSTQTETSFDMSNFDAGSLTIKITATKENWLTSQGSATLSKMRLKTPEVIVSVDPATNSYILKWDSVKYADTYVLKYGEKEIEIKATNYTIDKNSAVWGGNNTTTFTVDAFDSKADYLISAGSKDITINKIYSLNIEKSIEDAGSTALEGNVWQPITVSFNLNGASGSVASQTVTTTKGLTYPSIPTRSGYIFRGWFTEKSCENLYDFTAAIKNNLTLYAGWQSYSGTFIELNSGSKSYSSNTSYKYYYFRALSETQIRIGYSQTSSSPTSYLMIYDVTKGSAWTDDQSFKNTTPGTTNFYPTAGHVYYIRTHSSTSTTLNLSVYTYPSDGFLPNDGGKAVADYVIGTSSNEATNCVLFNNEYTLTATMKSGYTWVGWFDGDTKLTGDLSYTFTLPAESVTYTAKWIKITLEKSLTEAGTINSLDDTYKPGDEVTVTATETNLGYTWVGWYDGESLLTSEFSYIFNMPAESVTYTAKWIKVTLNKNGNGAGTISSLDGTYKSGDEVTINVTKTNEGYTWIGWYKGDTLLTNELSYTFNMPSEDVTYTAKWSTDVQYINADGDITRYTNGDIMFISSGGNRTLTGWYLFSGTISGSYTLTVSGEAHIILADNCKWTVKAIQVSENNSLHIYAQSLETDMGTLVVNGNIGGVAGVSGVSGEREGANGTAGTNGNNSGMIVINGGNVKAVNIGGGNGGAGGNGKYGKDAPWYPQNGGNGGDGGNGGTADKIIINNGIITANLIGGGHGGAGGKGGDGGDAERGKYNEGGGNAGVAGKGGNGGAVNRIEINGGIVTAEFVGGGKGGDGGSGSIPGWGAGTTGGDAGDAGNGGNGGTIVLNKRSFVIQNIGGGAPGKRGYTNYGSNGKEGIKGSTSIVYYNGSSSEWSAISFESTNVKVIYT